jgi:hypothetical protein
MGKDNQKGTYFMVPMPYIPEEEKEADPSDGKPPSIKLLLDSEGKKIDNPTVHVQPTFNGGTTEQFFKWFQSLTSLLAGQSVGEHFRVALQALMGYRQSDLATRNGPREPETSRSSGFVRRSICTILGR